MRLARLTIGVAVFLAEPAVCAVLPGSRLVAMSVGPQARQSTSCNIRWRYVWGPGPDDSVRGVNAMRVIDGKIVEAAGYSKTVPIVAALES